MVQNFLTNFVAEKQKLDLRQFRALALPMMDRLYNTALRLTENRLDAEDLVQDTYLRAWRYFNRFESGTNFTAWIFRILTNNFINYYRKKRRQPVQVDFEVTLATYDNKDPGDIDSERLFDSLHDLPEIYDDDISTALQQLPEQYRLVVLLCDVNELSYKETAKALNCPIGTVMSRVSRGRQMLARSLKKYAVENGFICDMTSL